MRLYAVVITFVALAFSITTTWFGHDLHESRTRGHALQTALFECEERETSLEAACRIPDAAMMGWIDHLEEVNAALDECCMLCAKELL